MNDSADRGQTSLTKRLLFVGTISALILILLLTLLVDRSIRNIWQTELDQDLETSAALARAGTSRIGRIEPLRLAASG